ncbi:MAG TPA: hypothetical protein DC049_02995, partial [Spirochaetia bacterium]|nr:hypothetical protein [Spirochaetia bacterium]
SEKKNISGLLMTIKSEISAISDPKYYYLPYYAALLEKNSGAKETLLLDSVRMVEATRNSQEQDDDKISYFTGKVKIYEELVEHYLAAGRLHDAYHFVYRCKSRTFNEIFLTDIPQGRDFISALSARAGRRRIIDFFICRDRLLVFSVSQDSISIHEPTVTPEKLRLRIDNINILIKLSLSSRGLTKVSLRKIILQGLKEISELIFPEYTAGCCIIPHLFLHNFPFGFLCLQGSEQISVFSSISTLIAGAEDRPVAPELTCFIDPLENLPQAAEEKKRI